MSKSKIMAGDKLKRGTIQMYQIWNAIACPFTVLGGAIVFQMTDVNWNHWSVLYTDAMLHTAHGRPLPVSEDSNIHDMQYKNDMVAHLIPYGTVCVYCSFFLIGYNCTHIHCATVSID